MNTEITIFGRAIKVRYILITGLVLLGALALFGILRGIYVQVNPISISKVPGDAKLYVNDKEVWGDRANLANGTYSIRAEKDGFSSYSGTVIIDDFNKYIAVALQPESDSAKRWAADNESAYLDQEAAGEATIGASGKNFADANPIVSQLPIEGYTYTVGYKLDQSDSTGKSIIITIDTTSGYRNAAIGSIYNVGFDPGDYKLQFSDYTNPFEEVSHATQN